VAGDVAGLFRQQENDGIGDFVGLTDPPHRNKCGVVVRVTFGPFGQSRRLRRAWDDRIHPDAPVGVLMRYKAGPVARLLDLQRPSVELRSTGLATENTRDLLSQCDACHDADGLKPWATTNFLMRAI
jgi:hypothetical protein